MAVPTALDWTATAARYDSLHPNEMGSKRSHRTQQMTEGIGSSNRGEQIREDAYKALKSRFKRRKDSPWFGGRNRVGSLGFMLRTGTYEEDRSMVMLFGLTWYSHAQTPTIDET